MSCQRCEREADWRAIAQVVADRSPGGISFMQSWPWATFKQREGYHTACYGVFDQSLPVGGGILYWFPRPGMPNLLLAPGGPIALPGYEQRVLGAIAAQAQVLATQWGAIGLRIEPGWVAVPPWLTHPDPDPSSAGTIAETGLLKFVRSPADLLPSETLIVDLQPSQEAILAQMKPKGRYNIRLAQRHGVTTEFTTDSQAIPKFYGLFKATVQRQKFFGEPYGFFINLCQTLCAAGMAEIGLARCQGELLAAMVLVYGGDRAVYLYGGRSLQQPEVMAGYALHWAAMQRAKARGCRQYDFYGYTEDPQHSYAQFSQFKRQFGGSRVTTIGAYDLWFYHQLAEVVIKVLEQL